MRINARVTVGELSDRDDVVSRVSDSERPDASRGHFMVRRKVRAHPGDFSKIFVVFCEYLDAECVSLNAKYIRL